MIDEVFAPPVDPAELKEQVFQSLPPAARPHVVVRVLTEKLGVVKVRVSRTISPVRPAEGSGPLGSA